MCFSSVGGFKTQGRTNVEPGRGEARVFDMLSNEAKDLVLAFGKKLHVHPFSAVFLYSTSSLLFVQPLLFNGLSCLNSPPCHRPLPAHRFFNASHWLLLRWSWVLRAWPWSGGV